MNTGRLDANAVQFVKDALRGQESFQGDTMLLHQQNIERILCVISGEDALYE